MAIVRTSFERISTKVEKRAHLYDLESNAHATKLMCRLTAIYLYNQENVQDRSNGPQHPYTRWHILLDPRNRN
jgi:hypothetical protein